MPLSQKYHSIFVATDKQLLRCGASLGPEGDSGEAPRDPIMSHDDSHSRACAPPSIPASHRAAGRKGVNYIVGPKGDVITLADLPSPLTTRWVMRRKAEVVLAVRGGLLSLEEACGRYRLTKEEFLGWQDAIERYGLLGLRSTHLRRDRRGD